ncbi:glycosyltransferase family protein [Larkinella terrae]|uniref:Glycosyl transferase n=1 Tax=Larkinella terrae TaxID=2025311 RepID=A0A7K0ET68_9BACT|nr:glycosyltransferase family protein [Larkinella terrae]MRS65015.1 glycosyl transferase [Larkinella terrae]
MRILFLVQGEGRGHLTQALSFAQLAESAGHEVIGALVGVTQDRPTPAFFSEQFPAPLTPLPSPGLVYHTQTNALQPSKTAWKALLNARAYRRSIRQIRDVIESRKPDVVINFYELLGGLTYGFYRPSVPMICIAHQYLAFHPRFPFPAGQLIDRALFKLTSRLTAWGAEEMLALSFDQQPDVPGRRLRVVPPLLRREVAELNPTTGDFFLAYTTQPGLVTELIKTHQQHPEIPMRIFHSGAQLAEERIDETLTYHAINGQRFLDAMQQCRAVVTTAGFESVCEAFYLGKPVLMIPQPNHFEQACNALDGQRAGVGVSANTFDLNPLLTFMPQYTTETSEQFRAWYGRGYYLFLAALNRAVQSKTSKSRQRPGALSTAGSQS